VFRGHADVALNARGVRQAQAAARLLAREPVLAVYSSPLQRAAMTAAAIAATRDLAVRIEPRLTDLHFGDWEGKTLSQVRGSWPEAFARWERNPELARIPGGEGLAGVRARAAAAIEDLAARHAGETIAVVTHRVLTKVLLCYVLGLDDSHFWQIRQDTACINRLERSPQRWVVASMNDTCHLRRARVSRARDF
jgi:broad specificity phosphatase PhoE